MMDKEDPTRCRGYGFVTFENAENVKRAVAQFHGTTHDGRTLKDRLHFSISVSVRGGMASVSPRYLDYQFPTGCERIVSDAGLIGEPLREHLASQLWEREPGRERRRPQGRREG